MTHLDAGPSEPGMSRAEALLMESPQYLKLCPRKAGPFREKTVALCCHPREETRINARAVSQLSDALLPSPVGSGAGSDSVAKVFCG